MATRTQFPWLLVTCSWSWLLVKMMVFPQHSGILGIALGSSSHVTGKPVTLLCGLRKYFEMLIHMQKKCFLCLLKTSEHSVSKNNEDCNLKLLFLRSHWIFLPPYMVTVVIQSGGSWISKDPSKKKGCGSHFWYVWKPIRSRICSIKVSKVNNLLFLNSADHRDLGRERAWLPLLIRRGDWQLCALSKYGRKRTDRQKSLKIQTH